MSPHLPHVPPLTLIKFYVLFSWVCLTEIPGATLVYVGGRKSYTFTNDQLLVFSAKTSSIQSPLSCSKLFCTIPRHWAFMLLSGIFSILFNFNCFVSRKEKIGSIGFWYCVWKLPVFCSLERTTLVEVWGRQQNGFALELYVNSTAGVKRVLNHRYMYWLVTSIWLLVTKNNVRNFWWPFCPGPHNFWLSEVLAKNTSCVTCLINMHPAFTLWATRLQHFVKGHHCFMMNFTHWICEGYTHRTNYFGRQLLDSLVDFNERNK